MGITADCITDKAQVRGSDYRGNETSASCRRSIRFVSFYKHLLQACDYHPEGRAGENPTADPEEKKHSNIRCGGSGHSNALAFEVTLLKRVAWREDKGDEGK